MSVRLAWPVLLALGIGAGMAHPAPVRAVWYAIVAIGLVILHGVARA